LLRNKNIWQNMSKNMRQAALVMLIFSLVMSVWEMGTRLSAVPVFILPPPSLIARQLGQLLVSPIFWFNLGYSLQEMLLGYLLAVLMAVLLGVAISQIRLLQLGLMPYIVAFQTIPTIALAPIFLQWFGYGMASKVVMAALIAFFPILLNVIAGLQSAKQEEIEMLKSFGASRRQILLKIKIPNAFPFVFTGLGLGLIFALIGVIVAEFVGAQHGLGKMLLQFNEQFNIAGMFAILVILALIGVIMHALIEYARRKIVFWGGEG